MTVEPDREQLLDELGRCFMRAALNRLLAGQEENGDELTRQVQPRRRERNNKRDDYNRTPPTNTNR